MLKNSFIKGIMRFPDIYKSFVTIVIPYILSRYNVKSDFFFKIL